MDDFKSLTVAQLRVELQKQNQKVSGTKAELIERLQAARGSSGDDTTEKRSREEDEKNPAGPPKKKLKAEATPAPQKPKTFQKQSKFPASFECKSGELLWGQMHCLMEGSESKTHDTTKGPVSAGGGGTILQSNFSYRVAAKKGRYDIFPVYAAPKGNMAKKYETAFLVCHETQDPNEIIKRCRNIGISHSQKHGDKNIVYVNRYDWGYHHGNEDAFKKACQKLVPKKSKKGDSDSEEGEEYYEQMMGQRLIMCDAADFHPFLLGSAGKKKVFGEGAFTTDTGVHIHSSDTEYELAWMVFSGKKSEEFPNSDEFVAFVYDHTYQVLNVEEGDDMTVMVEQGG